MKKLTKKKKKLIIIGSITVIVGVGIYLLMKGGNDVSPSINPIGGIYDQL